MTPHRFKELPRPDHPWLEACLADPDLPDLVDEELRAMVQSWQ